VVFVVCDFLKTSWFEVITTMMPLLQNFYQYFLSFIQKKFGTFYDYFLQHFLWVEWNYTWLFVLKAIQQNWIVIMVILAMVYHHRTKNHVSTECKGKRNIK